jgi:hypothetical protein
MNTWAVNHLMAERTCYSPDEIFFFAINLQRIGSETIVIIDKTGYVSVRERNLVTYGNQKWWHSLFNKRLREGYVN